MSIPRIPGLVGFRRTTVPLYLGLGLNATACSLYYIAGYSHYVPLILVISLAIVGYYFKSWRSGDSAFATFKISDAYLLTGVLVCFAPFYLFLLEFIPFQLDSDEVHLTDLMQDPSGVGHFDLFGLSFNHNIPNFINHVFGFFAGAFGAVTWPHVRIVHALSGLLIIALSYLFFRTAFDSQRPALLGAVLIGAQHVLLGISRMAMRDNTALLFEVAALLFLLAGLRARSLLWSYIGGVIAGLAWYSYMPGRIILVIWFSFLLAQLVLHRKAITLSQTLRLAAATLLGLMLVIGPYVVSNVKKQSDGPSYYFQQVLLFPEGRELQRDWVKAETPLDGVITNVVSGLTVFNSGKQDHGFIYENRRSGFVDPLTGILLWIGIIAVLWKRIPRAEDLLALTGFAVIYLMLSFVINKAPNYTRLLVILPFVVYFVVRGLDILASRLAARARSESTSRHCLRAPAYCVALVAVLNLYIYGDYAARGLINGDGIGGMARYVTAREDHFPYTYYLVSEPDHPLWADGQAWHWWHSNLPEFAGIRQIINPVSAELLAQARFARPSTVFLPGEVWPAVRDQLLSTYGDARVHKISPHIIAFELSDPMEGSEMTPPKRAPCSQYEGSILQTVCKGWQRFKNWKTELTGIPLEKIVDSGPVNYGANEVNWGEARATLPMDGADLVDVSVVVPIFNGAGRGSARAARPCRRRRIPMPDAAPS